jgi:hypothetical protein
VSPLCNIPPALASPNAPPPPRPRRPWRELLLRRLKPGRARHRPAAASRAMPPPRASRSRDLVALMHQKYSNGTSRFSRRFLELICPIQGQGGAHVQDGCMQRLGVRYFSGIWRFAGRPGCDVLDRQRTGQKVRPMRQQGISEKQGSAHGCMSSYFSRDAGLGRAWGLSDMQIVPLAWSKSLASFSERPAAARRWLCSVRLSVVVWRGPGPTASSHLRAGALSTGLPNCPATTIRDARRTALTRNTAAVSGRQPVEATGRLLTGRPQHEAIRHCAATLDPRCVPRLVSSAIC